MWWVICQYKMWFSIKVREGNPLPPSVFFSTPPLFNFFFCSWTKNVSSVRKCKNLPEMVIISRDIGCFMLALFYLENVMGDIQYKIWFSITVRGGTPSPLTLSVFLYPSPFQLFSGVELKLIVSSIRKCRLTCLSGNYLQSYKMFYVGTSFLRTFDGWYAI